MRCYLPHSYLPLPCGSCGAQEIFPFPPHCFPVFLLSPHIPFGAFSPAGSGMVWALISSTSSTLLQLCFLFSDRSRSGSVGMGYGDPHPYSRTPTSVGSFRPGFGSRSGSVSGGVVMTTDGVPPLMPQGSSASLLRSTSAPPQQFQGSVSSQASVSQHGWGSPGQGSGSPNSGSLARRSSHGSATASVASLPVRAGSAVHTYTHRASFSGAATQSGW